MIQIKRVYEPFSETDRYRVLVDRLWPRGVSKTKARLNLWLKDIAPSIELRKWFGHDPKKWPEFEKKYTSELKENYAIVNELYALEKKHKTVTLLYGARDREHNEAIVLLSFLRYI